jgi:hypothetical protein
MHTVDMIPIIFVGTVFVATFGYLLLDSFWGRATGHDDTLGGDSVLHPQRNIKNRLW